ncbi:hypothetical protein [Dactylosporangium maewongense]|uniref:hypothetical protein n=1 Tax=Dactylosporangium maewongense TaxID=634393 RepID=UPI0031D709CE
MITPNRTLRDARLRTHSPLRAGQSMSRSELADLVNATLDRLHPGRDLNAHYVDSRWIGKLERGEHRWPSDERRAALRHALGATTDTELDLYIPRRTDGPRNHPPGFRQVDDVTEGTDRSPDTVEVMYRRTALLFPALVTVAAGQPALPDGSRVTLRALQAALLIGGGSTPDLNELTVEHIWRSVAAAHDGYQQARYLEVAARLPSVLARANELAEQSAGAVRRRARYALALAYIAASKVAAKFADGSLAWVAADRAAQIAATVDAPAIAGLAAYQSSCALLSLYPDSGPAEQLVHTSLSQLSRAEVTAQTTAAAGALNLLGAVIAARSGARKRATAHLAAASRLACSVPADSNQLWTAFNATNVLIHRTSAENALHRYDDAIQAAHAINTAALPGGLVGRRAQIHLDLVIAHVTRSDGLPTAVHHVVSAGRIAPQLFQVHPENRQLVADMLKSSTGTDARELRTLAEAAGIGR